MGGVAQQLITQQSEALFRLQLSAKKMWSFWILLCAALFTESFASRTDYLELLFGNQLTIKLPTSWSDSMDFTSADESRHYTVWSKKSGSVKGTVRGSGDDRHYVLSYVNFDDQGTYTQRNYWDKVTYVAKVKVFPKKYTKDCVAGETLNILLEGIKRDDASLRFSNQDVNVMLVQRGLPAHNLLDFSGRIRVTTSSIQVLNVNVSDLGNYTLFDGQDRKAITVRLNLVDHHEGINASPLMALLLLLGIPAGICCCCRKRIFKKSSQSTAMTTVLTQNVSPPPGPPPAYSNPVPPAGPNPMYTPGYPTDGASMIHPPPADPSFPPQPQYGGQPAMPPNPMYPPVYPAPGDSAVHPPPSDPSFPPQPQYGGQPAMPPNPAFTPVMYTAPPGSQNEGNKGDIKMNEISSATPLLGPSNLEVGPPPAPHTGTDILTSSNSAAQFNIDAGKSSSYNFL
uniref:Uncharacterized protein n=1 Tax=Pygocentrus nattereri TaxID=42514 RepID=A0AAR2LRV7_PYGNA